VCARRFPFWYRISRYQKTRKIKEVQWENKTFLPDTSYVVFELRNSNSLDSKFGLGNCIRHTKGLLPVILQRSSGKWAKISLKSQPQRSINAFALLQKKVSGLHNYKATHDLIRWKQVTLFYLNAIWKQNFITRSMQLFLILLSRRFYMSNLLLVWIYLEFRPQQEP